jgi:Tfp pilus assembly protein PilF
MPTVIGTRRRGRSGAGVAAGLGIVIAGVLATCFVGTAAARAADDERAHAEAVALDARGLAYLHAKSYYKAIAKFGAAITLDPTYAAAYYDRGLAYEALGGFENALPSYDEVIRLEPTDADAFTRRCFARTVLAKQLADALSDCDESLRLRPKDEPTLRIRSFTYLKLNQAEHAIADAEAALALDSSDPDALLLRGIARRRTGQSASADADVSAAKRINRAVQSQYFEYNLWDAGRVDGVDFANFTYPRTCVSGVAAAPVRDAHYSYEFKNMGNGVDISIEEVISGPLRADGSVQAVILMECSFPVGAHWAFYLFDVRGAQATLITQIADHDSDDDTELPTVTIADHLLHVSQCGGARPENPCSSHRTTTYHLRGSKLEPVSSVIRPTPSDD